MQKIYNEVNKGKLGIQQASKFAGRNEIKTNKPISILHHLAVRSISDSNFSSTIKGEKEREGDTTMAASNGSEFFELDIGEANEVLVRPSNAESVAEDEEELRWAALERLPSLKQKNFALLRSPSDSGGEENRTKTVDVRKLDRLNRQLVVKNAFATNEQDNYRLLSAIKERLDRYYRPQFCFGNACEINS